MNQQANRDAQVLKDTAKSFEGLQNMLINKMGSLINSATPENKKAFITVMNEAGIKGKIEQAANSSAAFQDILNKLK